MAGKEHAGTDRRRSQRLRDVTPSVETVDQRQKFQKRGGHSLMALSTHTRSAFFLRNTLPPFHRRIRTHAFTVFSLFSRISVMLVLRFFLYSHAPCSRLPLQVSFAPASCLFSMHSLCIASNRVMWCCQKQLRAWTRCRHSRGCDVTRVKKGAFGF